MTTSFLSQIREPADLKELGPDDLTQLASEIREFMIEKISRTGGHLSPNLGIVELTLALHRVFESPLDRIYWDVGHQAYVHKIVTGRQGGFDSLRTFGGMTGYPSRAESQHDFVENSHASVALSYGLGNAIANAEAGNGRYTVAVIGDGALTGGVAYEALNHIAVTRPPNLIIVVNDNGRSYAPTVGGLAALAHLRFDPRYEHAKKLMGRILRSLPIVGDTADELAFRLKESLKQLVEPATFFDVLGLKYSGTLDGHDFEALEEGLEHAKDMGEPAIVHVITEKGRGYEPAINDEVEKLHGVGTFDVQSGRPTSSELKMTDIAARAVLHAARENEDVIAISAAMVSPTGLSEMAEEFPDRVIDTGIAEQHAVALAAGLAMSGKRPVVALYSTFLQRAFDEVVMDVALHDLPVTFLLDRAGVTGPDGPSHHGAFDLSFLRMIPGMTIGAPSDATELCAMVAAGIAHDGPTAIRFPKSGAGTIPELPVEPIEIGVWEELESGSDVLLLATGRMVEIGQKASLTLAQRGVSAGLINARWVKPMDERLIDWIDAYPLVITLEDNVVAGGFGAGVLEAASAHDLAGRIRIIGIPDEFLPPGSAGEVIKSIGLDAESIAERVAGWIAGTGTTST
ncbi:MAG: 1-deoxy-D-xylulose-5-phosphate synthase [Acidimicrobiia bacterium]|nr:1-deoxy-D-xylulose-5-phosphate synthase [Acidimicrobiia bacterium]